MGVYVDIDKIPLLKGALDRRHAMGVEEGREEGLGERIERGRRALVHGLTNLLEPRFGVLPKWAVARIGKAAIEELEIWLGRVLSRTTIESVIGRRR